jgi:hypothetical protein
MSTKNELTREAMWKVIKEASPKKVRQCNLTKYLQELKDAGKLDTTLGTVRGIYNRIDGIGGCNIKGIPQIRSLKENGKAYYVFDGVHSTENVSQMDQIVFEFRKKGEISMSTRTELTREAIRKFIKEASPEKVRQSDLIKHLQELKDAGKLDTTLGTARGIFNRMDGVGGCKIKPIPQIRSLKENGKAYYIFDEDYLTGNVSQMDQIVFEFKKFQSILDKRNLLIIDLNELKNEDVHKIISLKQNIDAIAELLGSKLD